MAKTSIRSHVIITETAKPQAVCVCNLGVRAGKTDPGFNSPEANYSVPLLKATKG